MEMEKKKIKLAGGKNLMMLAHTMCYTAHVDRGAPANFQSQTDL